MPCEQKPPAPEDDARNRRRLARLHANEIRLLLLPLGRDEQAALEYVGCLLRSIGRNEPTTRGT